MRKELRAFQKQKIVGIYSELEDAKAAACKKQKDILMVDNTQYCQVDIYSLYTNISSEVISVLSIGNVLGGGT